MNGDNDLEMIIRALTQRTFLLTSLDPTLEEFAWQVPKCEMKANTMRIFQSRRNKELSLLRASDYFDGAWYKNEYPDIAKSGMNSELHYLRYGASEGRNPSPRFDTNFYIESNPDVQASGINPLVHFIKYGHEEARAPLGLPVDTEFYIALNPEASIYADGAALHYQCVGRSRHYQFRFDEDWYRSEYPDLNSYQGSLKEHFIKSGQYEGRIPAFDANWYRSEYLDILPSGMEPIEHYRRFGREVGLHAGFNRSFYLSANPDVKSSSEAYDHYNVFGRHEGRAPGFNRYWYTKFYRDLTSDIDPFCHYITSGSAEGRLLSFTDRMRISKWGSQNANTGPTAATHFDWRVPELHPDFMPKVTVIVPNFNHEPYLRQRLDTIYNQTYKNIEVILMDDASRDKSVDILLEYKSRYSEITSCFFNRENSGGAFFQWKKGFELAKGSLIWIAESDDYSTVDFLTELVQLFRNNSVMLAFGRTDFVQGPENRRVWTSEEYWADIGFKLGNMPILVPGNQLVESAWGARNIIPNVSGAVFRNPGTLSILNDAEWQNLRMCGDWILYLAIIRGGAVAYNPRVTNFYRQHPQNTSISTHDKDIYYQEHEVVACYLAKTYAVEPRVIKFHEEVLYRHWCMKRGNDSRREFEALFSADKVLAEQKLRKINIAIAIYGFVTGGGETLPILLANILHARGHTVTLLNFQMEKTNEGIKSTLDSAIPILEPNNSADAGRLLQDLEVEVVHSHHGWVDITLAMSLKDCEKVAHVVTTHGFYEVMDPSTVNKFEPTLRSVNEFVYIADKNLMPFSPAFRLSQSFNKISNTVSISAIRPIARTELALGDSDFVICLASRAIAEKGWDEAIAAVKIANENSERRIQLLLIGDGPEAERLGTKGVPPFVKLIGFRSNVRDYFALADLGLIMSKFKGESCPLVLIECLSVGRPVLTTNVGEVVDMLRAETGSAGVVRDLKDSEVDVPSMSREIKRLANDRSYYISHLRNVGGAMEKFEQDTVIDKYLDIYKSAILKKKDVIARISLSVILVTYNMERELPRTLYTLSPSQQMLESGSYEVIVVDNGSTCEYDYEKLREICPNTNFFQMPQPSVSPVDAVNRGLGLARGDVVCVFIDAARMASPRLLQTGLAACQMNPRAVVGSLSFHLGLEAQNMSVRKGYNQVIEDGLLDTIDWRSNGYKLFNIASFDPSSRFGLYECPAETNSLFLSREMWNEIGGLDPAFKARGGGLTNLDIWRRLCEDERNVLITLIGEGTFHQFHGGVATNALDDVWEELHSEYIKIRGKVFQPPKRRPYHLGRAHEWLMDFERRIQDVRRLEI